MSRKKPIRYDWSARGKQLNVIEKPREQIKKIENKKKTTKKKKWKRKKIKIFYVVKRQLTYWQLQEYAF